MFRRKRKSSLTPLQLAIAGGTSLLAVIAMKAASNLAFRRDLNGESVVIIGGSRGLGLELARQLARRGARLTLLARDVDELQRAEAEMASIDAEVMTMPCDIRDQNQVEHALGRVVRRYGRIDVLVNNAGIIQVGPVEHMEIKDYENAMATHFWGPLYATLAAMHYMRQEGGGNIVNITSIGGEVAVPHLSPYTASKFALVGLSDGMRSELSRDNIKVTTVVPGLMRTGSHVNAFFKGHQDKEYAWFSVFDSLPLTSTSVQNAAKRIVHAIEIGESHVVITPQARLLMLANSLFPGLTASVMKWFNRALPRPAGEEGNVLKSGWESQSRLSPSALTALGDREALEQNQLKVRPPLES